MKITLFIVSLSIVFIFIFFIKRNNQKRSNENERANFSQYYTEQFKALGRKRTKNTEDFKQLYKKMMLEKKEKKLDFKNEK